MKVVMLGHSDAGKTTYMASAYGTLLTPVEGLSLRASDDQHHRELVELHDAIQHQRWPLPSDRRQSYDLRLMHNGYTKLEFTWIDYRGGALEERSSEAQTQELIKDLTTADGILAFHPCTEIGGSRFKQRKLGRLIQLLTTAVGAIERPMPLALVLTKHDLYSGGEADIDHALEGLTELVRRSKYVSGTVIPVVCGPWPSNVAKPVLFTLFHQISIQYHVYAHYYEQAKMRAEHATKQAGGVSDFFSSLFGQETWGDSANKAMREAKVLFDRVTSLQGPGQALSTYLSGLKHF